MIKRRITTYILINGGGGGKNWCYFCLYLTKPVIEIKLLFKNLVFNVKEKRKITKSDS